MRNSGVLLSPLNCSQGREVCPLLPACVSPSQPEVPPLVLILLLALVGVLGLLLNCLVILGVRSNRKLSTSINILLLWLCGASILEASLGVTAKCLVIGGVISGGVSRPYIDPVCRGLIAVPFFFSFTSQSLWTCISLYRLFLVIQSIRGSAPPSRRVKATVTQVLPLLSATVALAISTMGFFIAEPLILFRLCLGACDDFVPQEKFSLWFLLFMIVPTLLLYAPAVVSYAAIFLLVHRATNRRKSKEDQQASQLELPSSVMCHVTMDPGSRMTVDDLTCSVEALEEAEQPPTRHRNSSLAIRILSRPSCTPAPGVLHPPRSDSLYPDRSPSFSLPPACQPPRPRSKLRRRVANRNIISAKLSFLVILLMLVGVGVLQFTYGLTQDLSMETRVFLNALFIDLMLGVMTPLVLLYSSIELRNTLWIILRTKLCPPLLGNTASAVLRQS